MLEQLKSDLKDAMRAKDETRRNTIRILMAAFKNAAIEKGGELDESGSLEILAREAKKRREAAESFRGGGREDAALQEELELAIIEDYLPKQLSEDEVRAIAREVIAAVEPSGPRDMGKVMGEVMPRLKGLFDGKLASGIIKAEFNDAIG